MIAHVVLVDTGPLVGLLNQRDQNHETACRIFEKTNAPLVSTWPVITEAAWLLRQSHEGVAALLEMVATGYLKITELDELAVKRISNILNQYQSLSLQLADASLVHLAEQLNTTRLITFDERDFRVVCLEDGRHFELITE